MGKDPERTYCEATTSNGTPCRRPSGEGTSHKGFGTCYRHGGSTQNEYLHVAKAQAVVMGVSTVIEPHDALLQCVYITAGEVAYCNQRIAGMSEEEAVGTPMVVTTKETELDNGDIVNSIMRQRKTPELNIWIKVRQEAVERLAKFAKMALDAGVEERKVQVAEKWSEPIGLLMRNIIEDLDLTPEQMERAPGIVQRHVLALEKAPEIVGTENVLIGQD